MATIVNNPSGGEHERVVERSDGGWAVAVIVLLAVIVVGAVVWMRYYNAPAAQPAQQTQTPGSANINVTLPSSGSDNSGSSNGANSGANTNNTGTQTPAQ